MESTRASKLLRATGALAAGVADSLASSDRLHAPTVTPARINIPIGTSRILVIDGFVGRRKRRRQDYRKIMRQGECGIRKERTGTYTGTILTGFTGLTGLTDQQD
jgi:hypothetical protein